MYLYDVYDLNEVYIMREASDHRVVVNESK